MFVNAEGGVRMQKEENRLQILDFRLQI
jgi:hypothetical protein